MKILTTIVLLWSAATQQGSVAGAQVNFGTALVDSIGTIIPGVIQEIPKLIPTPQELFQAPKQILFGVPEVAVFEGISALCSLYLASGTINPQVTPEENQLFLQLRQSCKTTIFPLGQAEKILQSPEFDANKKVVIFVYGWLTNTNQSYIGDMAKAYNCRGGTNFFVFDTSDFLETVYTWSAFNTQKLGRYLGEAVVKLAETVPIENIHLVGHSLGAHIVGYAGRYFSQTTGKNLTRITGLDPANPCFNEGESITGLQRGDAEFIDIIHSNPGVFGKPISVGDIDFYPEGRAPIKPGCYYLGCSHTQSIAYYTESVYPGNEKDFLGTECTSLIKLNDGFCKKGRQAPMGYAVPFDLKGDYFLSVNGKEPFGKNANGLGTRSSSTCGSCTTV